MLGRRAPAQEQRRAARGDGRAGGRPVRGEVIGRSLVLGLLLAGAGITGPATAAERCTECVTAGAASDTLRVPPGTPLAGYGAMKRRLLFPNVFDRHAHAFWFVPATGERDPLVTRALVLEAGATRLAWVTLDLVAVDGAFVAALRERLARAGVPATALVVSASHTHSGPGAFMSSSLVGFVAVDRFDPEVRDALVASAVSAIRQADRARTPALVAATSGSAPAVTASRLGKPLDPEIVVLKLTTLSGSPLALVWNYAIHGTMLSASNRRLSGDVMGVASARLEQRLGVPALFVNGAVGDVSPARHGEAAMVETAAALASAVDAARTRATGNTSRAPPSTGTRSATVSPRRRPTCYAGSARSRAPRRARPRRAMRTRPRGERRVRRAAPRPGPRRGVNGAGELLRGGETPGERGLLARGGVAVDHALADGAVERADRLEDGGGLRGPLGAARRLDRATELRAYRPVAQAPALALPHPLRCRLRVRQIGAPRRSVRCRIRVASCRMGRGFSR